MILKYNKTLPRPSRSSTESSFLDSATGSSSVFSNTVVVVVVFTSSFFEFLLVGPVLTGAPRSSQVQNYSGQSGLWPCTESSLALCPVPCTSQQCVHSYRSGSNRAAFFLTTEPHTRSI